MHLYIGYLLYSIFIIFSINKKIGLDQLLDRMDSVQYLQAGENGVFKIIIEREANELVSMRHIFEIQDKTYDSTGVVYIDTLPTFQVTELLPINLSSEDVLVKSATIKSGILTLSFNITSANFDYTAILTSENITDMSGNPIQLNFSNTQHQQSINLSNHKIMPNAMGTLIIGATITVSADIPVYQISYEFLFPL